MSLYIILVDPKGTYLLLIPFHSFVNLYWVILPAAGSLSPTNHYKIKY